MHILNLPTFCPELEEKNQDSELKLLLFCGNNYKMTVRHWFQFSFFLYIYPKKFGLEWSFIICQEKKKISV